MYYSIKLLMGTWSTVLVSALLCGQAFAQTLNDAPNRESKRLEHLRSLNHLKPPLCGGSFARLDDAPNWLAPGNGKLEWLESKRLEYLRSPNCLKSPRMRVEYGWIMWQLGEIYDGLEEWEKAKAAYVELFSLSLPKESIGGCLTCPLQTEDEVIQSSFDRLIDRIRTVEESTRKKIKDIDLPRPSGSPSIAQKLIRVRAQGYVNKEGLWAIPPKFDEEWHFVNGKAKVKVLGSVGFIDRSGRWLVKPTLADAQNFAEGVAPAAVKDGKEHLFWGYVNESGAFVIKPKFKRAEPFSEGLACVQTTVTLPSGIETNRWGYIDHTGAWVIAPTYMWCSSFKDGLSQASTTDNKHICLDKRGNIVSLPYRAGLDKFSEGLAPFSVNSKLGFLAIPSGQVVIQPQFEKANAFFEGRAQVTIPKKHRWFYSKMNRWEQLDNQIGFIDKTGKMVIEPNYDFASDFSEGVAFVESERKHFFINRLGQRAIDKTFTYGSNFSDGLAYVQIDDREVYIDHKGRVVFTVKPDWYTRHSFHEGLLIVTQMKCVPLDSTESKRYRSDYRGFVRSLSLHSDK